MLIRNLNHDGEALGVSVLDISMTTLHFPSGMKRSRISDAPLLRRGDT
jgi:hypothetical protein